MATDETERTRDGGAPAQRARVQRLLFVVASGGDLAFGGARVALDELDEVTIGRGEASGLTRVDSRARRITVGDARVSTRHARVVRDDGGFAIEDLGSTNGTTHNGEATARAPLMDGDLVAVGNTVLVYRELVDEGRASDAHERGARPGFATLDPAFARRLARLERVSSSTLAVLLIGETGTGKEVLARAVHTASKRPGPFVAVNCGAIPPTLVESHLFGHLRGAFSGAVADASGHVRAAQHGTLLLDEIGDLPLAAQASLLRVLQEGEVVPVGGTRPVRVDVRVIAATHRRLDELVARDAFRADLYARLAGYVFEVPTLGERRVDLGVLVASMVERGAIEARGELRLHREVVRALWRYPWPMNVRELEQAIRAGAVLAEDGLVTLADLPPAIAEAVDRAPEADDPPDETLRRELLARLAAAGGNVSEVAREMNKARQQIQRWLRRFGIDAEAFKSPTQKLPTRPLQPSGQLGGICFVGVT